MADTQGLGSPSPTWANRMSTSKSGELALELGKDLGISAVV